MCCDDKTGLSTTPVYAYRHSRVGVQRRSCLLTFDTAPRAHRLAVNQSLNRLIAIRGNSSPRRVMPAAYYILCGILLLINFLYSLEKTVDTHPLNRSADVREKRQPDVQRRGWFQIDPHQLCGFCFSLTIFPNTDIIVKKMY